MPDQRHTVDPGHEFGMDGREDGKKLVQNECKPQSWYIGSVDQGTTSTRFLIFDQRGTPVASHQCEFKHFYPHPGWMEQDPQEIVESVETCIEEAVDQFVKMGHSISDIKTVGITNQRETTVVWDSQNGQPLYNAIAWPDTRSQEIVQELKERKGAEKLQGLCGLPLSTYPSSVKLIWLLKNSGKVREAYERRQLVFGTIDAWLLYNLNGKDRNVHVTDVTNVSRTMFANLHTLEYDSTLLDFFQVDRDKVALPKIVPSADPNAFGAFGSGPLKDVTITGCLGDQSAALVGQLGFSPGKAKNTYGTGCFLLCNVGEKPVISNHGLLATVAYQFGESSKPIYALEGSIAAAGSAIKFLIRNFGFIEASHEINDLAATVEDNGGCVFVTAFSGLFAPYWIDDAKGTIFGITHHTEKGHLARAVIEATCFQTRAILDAMEKDSGHRLTGLAVDGGMSNSDFCMQTQANIINIAVDRPDMRETTALGAALAAGFAIHAWQEFNELQEINRENHTVFHPRISPSQGESMYKRWEKAVEMSRGWMKDARNP